MDWETNIGSPEAGAFLVRSASSLDIAAIRALEQHSTTAAHWEPGQYKRLFSASSSRTVLVVEDTSNESIQGLLVARKTDREWEIENIVVSERSQRRGIGTYLLTEFLNHAKRQGAAAVFLEVRESNLAAKALYREMNFEENGRRKSYYRDPEEDAILYRLEFT